jgi:hypothetical protein
MASGPPPDWWQEFINKISFKDIEERIFHAYVNDSQSVVADGGCVDLHKGTDGVWRYHLEEKGCDFKQIFVDATDPHAWVRYFDEVADVDPKLYERRPGETVTSRFSSRESNFRERDEVAHLESIRRAAESIPFWRNCHDLLYGPVVLRPKGTMVGIDWAEGTDRTVVSDPKKPDVL